MKKKILFLTGTRADYGKMKPLMTAVEYNDKFECHIFITGMHTLKEFGDTKSEILKDGYLNTHVYMNQIIEEPMDLVLANTINGFSRYIRELEPDLIIIHGDRVEALAGAISGAINNVLVAHIEGGELSGTIDESIRHSISKLAHIHFVSNGDAKNRLLQLGEDEKTIFIIGSPDIDIILQKPSVSIEKIKERYDIPFKEYAVIMYHPVTTEIDTLKDNVGHFVSAIIDTRKNYIVINPNNDHGYNIILDEYKRFDGLENIKMYPSIRFEFFIEILRNSSFIIGNSSAGIHESPVMGIPSVNIGTRQKNRFNHETIINCGDRKEEILKAIEQAFKLEVKNKTYYFGNGKSKEKFMETLLGSDIWQLEKQKIFNDMILPQTP